MADSRFHDRQGPHSLARIAEASECVLADPALADKTLRDVAPLASAGVDMLSFLDNPKYRAAFHASQAGACIVSEAMAREAPPGMAVLVSKNPYRSYALAAALFYPWPVRAGVHPTAIIDPSAQIGPDCTVEAYAVIGRGVVLGPGCWIGAHASLSHCILGARVRIHTGARIGQDGFGFALGAPMHLPMPQLGRVMIGDLVNIGANTTVDRGAGPDTEIGEGCVIDNLVQIAHNVRIGRGCVIAAQCGIAGSSVLEDFVVMGGQAGVSGHLTIGKAARIAAQSGVTKDVPAGEEWVGFPAAPRFGYWRAQARLKKFLSTDPSKGNP